MWINDQSKTAGAEVNPSVQESGSRDILLPICLFLKPVLPESAMKALAHKGKLILLDIPQVGLDASSWGRCAPLCTFQVWSIDWSWTIFRTTLRTMAELLSGPCVHVSFPWKPGYRGRQQDDFFIPGSCSNMFRCRIWTSKLESVLRSYCLNTSLADMRSFHRAWWCLYSHFPQPFPSLE